MIKNRLIITALTLSLLVQSQSQAQTMGFNPGSLAVSATIRQAFIEAGLSANSGSIIAAQARASAYLAGSVTRIAAGTVAVARSPTLLAITGVLIVGALIKSSDNSISISRNPDGTTTTNKIVVVPLPVSPAFKQGDILLKVARTGDFVLNMQQVITSFHSVNKNDNNGYTLSSCSLYSSSVYCYSYSQWTSSSNYERIAQPEAVPMGCNQDNILKNINGVLSCSPITPPPQNPQTPPTSVSTNQTLDTIQSVLNADEKKQVVSNESIANLVNAIGQQVQQDPTYNGPPFPVVTPNTVSNGLKNYNLNSPTVKDFTDTVKEEDVKYDPINPPTPTTGTTITYPNAPTTEQPEITPSPSVPGATVKPDFGIDPGIQQPNLEAVPTGTTVLNPILNILPGFKTWQIPAHNSVCPEPNLKIDAFGWDLKFTSHCELFEKIKPQLIAIETAAWTLLAILIVLAA